MKYQANIKNIRLAKRVYSKQQYSLDPEKKKAASRAYSKQQYNLNPDKKKAESKARHNANRSAKNASSRAYHSKNKDSICALKRDRYALAEPKPDQVELYMKDIQNKMCSDAKTKRQLIKTFKELNNGFTRRVTGKAVSRVAAQKLLNVALQMRKEHAGSLLRITKTVQGIQICDKK